MIHIDNYRDDLTSYTITNRISKLGFMRQIIHRLVYLMLAVFLIITGVSLVYASNRNFIESKLIVSQQVEDQVQVRVKPKNIYIPKINRSLNISDGYVIDDRWTISDTGVSFLTASAVPGEKGNSVLYGHNRDEILGKLWQVANGDLIYVVMDDGSFAKYEIFERAEIKPNQVEILNDVGDSRLTIYTCSGFLDSARFVVVARLITES